MHKSSYCFLMCLIILSSKLETMGSIKCNNTLIGSFCEKIRIKGLFGIQRHISIIYPTNQSTSSIDVAPKTIQTRILTYKRLFQNHFVSVLKSDYNVRQSFNNVTTLFIYPFTISNDSNICELIDTSRVNPYDYIFIYVANHSKQSLKMVLSTYCDLGYKSNIFLYYEVNDTTVFVEEVYKISANDSKLIEVPLLEYNAKTDTITHLSAKEKWKRRSDLRGITFDAFVKSFKPYVIHKKNNLDGKMGSMDSFEGMFIEMMSELEVKLNFTVNMKVANEEGYNEVIDKLENREKDMAIGVFSFTYDRSKSVDFSVAIHEDKSALLYLKKDFNIKWGSYARPFHSDSWMAVGAYVIVTALAIVMLSCVNHDFTSSYYFSMTTGKAFLFSLYSTIAKRFPSEPDSVACRIAFVTVSFAGFIIISLYRAMLGASLAITKDHPPINSMKEVLESDYDIITMGGTNYETYFTKAEHDSYLYSISKKKLILENWNSDDPMAAILFNILKTHRRNVLVYVDNEEIPSYHPDLACHFSSIDEEYTNIGAGFIFQKDWPFTRVINYHMLRMFEDGSIERIKNRWLPKEMLCNHDTVEPSNILDIFTLCVTLILGGIFAIISFLIELYHNSLSN